MALAGRGDPRAPIKGRCPGWALRLLYFSWFIISATAHGAVKADKLTVRKGHLSFSRCNGVAGQLSAPLGNESF